MDNMDENRIGKNGMTELNHEVSEATQRIWVDSQGRPAQVPSRRQAADPAAVRRDSAQSRRRAEQKKRERTTIIVLCAILAVLLIAVLIVVLFVLPSGGDNGTIRKNISAAGVDLGGMTRDQAIKALHAATDDTYSVIPMKVQVLDSELTLSPADTAARLDVEALADAALEYSRSSKNSTSSYEIPIAPYLHLDTDYIKEQLAQLGKQYSTTLKQSSFEISGTAPATGATGSEVDTQTVHQRLTIHIGTAEYSLNLDDLYNAIMKSYNSNIFTTTVACAVIAPNPLNYTAIYNQFCYDAVNAEFNDDFTLKSAEVYGYGFSLEDFKAAVENAPYGTDVAMELRYIRPAITSDHYADDVYQNILGIYSTPMPTDPNLVTNLKKAVSMLNGSVIGAGMEFSFNILIGEPDVKNGFVSAGVYLGRSYREVVGGGICQLASTIYACALMSDLQILERTPHSYAPTFISSGLDAEVYYGTSDLRIKNTTEKPIRLDIVIANDQLQVTMVGTDERDYFVEISRTEEDYKRPVTVYNTMLSTNPGGYKEGDVLSEGITGCTTTVLLTRYNKETGEAQTEEPIQLSINQYAALDRVVVKIQEDPAPPTPDPGTGTETPDPDEP